VNAEVAVPLVLALATLGAFVAVLALWDPTAKAWAVQSGRYLSWAETTTRALHTRFTARDLAFRHALLVVFAFAVGVTLHSIGIGLVVAAAACAAPFLWALSEAHKRRKAIEGQLDVMLQTLANNMLATQNVVDGFASIAANLPPPISQEAELVVKDVRVGARIEEAISNLSERCRSQHVDAVVTALSIGLKTGGDLGTVLKKIAGVVRETIRCEGVMAAKTSEGRTSAWLLGAAPIAFGIVGAMMMPEYTTLLWTTALGTFFLTAAAILDVIGILIVLKISKVDP
jgi:tight adherence protein B